MARPDLGFGSVREGRPALRERRRAGTLIERRTALALSILGVVLVAGTAGYMIIEGWGAWDAFYMTVISLTTVGYKEVHPLTRGGEVFTTLVLLLGVGTLFYTLTLLVARVVEGDLRDRWEKRRRDRMIDGLTQHYIICGYGRIGQTVAGEFRRHGVPFVVVDRDPERVLAAMEAGGLAVAADASSEDVLKRVGIDRARGLIAAVSTDAENVYTVLSARLLRPDLFIIARSESDDAGAKLRRAGADRVLSPYQMGATQMALTALRPAVVDFVNLATSSMHLELAMEQVRIEPGSVLAEQTLLGANMRQRYGAIVVGIQRASGRMEFNPAPDTAMHAGDHLVVLGPPDRVRLLEGAAQAAGSRS